MIRGLWLSSEQMPNKCTQTLSRWRRGGTRWRKLISRGSRTMLLGNSRSSFDASRRYHVDLRSGNALA
jgi:hypothetical protein